MSKKIFILLCCLLVATNVFADSLKDYVCVVKGNLSEKNKEFLAQYKDEFTASGYGSYAKYIENFLEGSFGSGFVHYASNGTPVVITNKHVVSEYETVNLIFENEDGSTSEFKDLKILSIDENTDIAIIELPASFKKKGLKFNTNKTTDGDEVWSAGFPGLGDEPLWQLGKGIVSNSKARIKDLSDSTLIQHTAQIDGGNSGGPLLVKDSSAPSGYSVIGINTWKAIYRQNTNYAIPASLVKNFVEKNIDGTATISIEPRVNALVKAMENEDTFYDVAKYISNKMVSESGVAAFKKVLSRSPESIRSYIVDTFSYNPLEGFRCSIAYLIWNEFRSEGEFEMPVVGTPSKNADVYSVDFNEGKDSVNSKWIKESGQWKLTEFESLGASKKASGNKKSGISFYVEDTGIMSVSASYVSSSIEKKTGYEFQVGFNMNYVGLYATYQKQDISYIYEGFYNDKSASVIGFCFNLKVPMLIDSYVVEPFAYAKAGLVDFFEFSGSDFSPLFFGYGFGINLGYEVSYSCTPYLTVKYNYSPFKFRDDLNEKIESHEVCVGIGLKFL